MKITTFFLLLCIMSVSARTIAQKITLNEKHVQLTDILAKISQQSGFDVVYDAQLLKKTDITVKVTDVNIEEALTKSLEGLGLNYQLTEKTILIIKEKETSLLDNLKDKLKEIIANIDVHGRIVGEDGQPLPGATITVKGGNNSTSTDANGFFTLKNVEPDATLSITFIGYEKNEIKAGKELGVIQMFAAQGKLDEVKIIAYGQTTERLSTGNISSISEREIKNQPVINPILTLEGLVPGIFIKQATGFSNSGVSVQIQGQNSIKNGNDPLYVIDGVPYVSQLVSVNLGSVLGSAGVGSNGNPFSFINPSNIESISILKDADATAIYGSRAANGAILITTKKGLVGETKVNVNLQNGWGSVPHFLPLMNTPQYLQMRREALKNDGISAPAAGDYDINGTWDTTRNVNWQKQLIGGTSHYEDYNADLSGGTANTQFFVGAAYHRETTVFPGDFADHKGSLYFNLNNSSTDKKFHFQISATYLNDNNSLPSVDLTSSAILLAPDAPVIYKADGSLNWASNAAGAATWTNPLATLSRQFQSKTNNLIGNALISYQIVQGLELKSNFGYTNLQQNEFTTTPQSSFDPSIWASRGNAIRNAQYDNSTISSWIIEPQITYKKSISRGVLDFLAGTTVQQNLSTGVQLNGASFISDEVLNDIHSAANVSVNSSVDNLYKYNALFGRLNYNWDNKYIVNISGRRDGSSRFGSANQFHNFGSVGAAWIFSEVNGIKNHLPLLSFGKLHASYGSTGNDQIGDYKYLNIYNSVTAQVPYLGVTGLTPNGLPNPYLEWELTRKTQMGIDLGFLKDKILLSLDYANNRSSNQLLLYALPSITGFQSISSNFPATVQNTSLEFTLATTNIKTGNFSWTSNLNLTVPRNKLVSFPNLSTSAYASSLVIGQPITIRKVVHFMGVDPATGVYQFSTANGAVTSNPNTTVDNTTLVNVAPTLYGGFSNSFRYKEFELTFLLQFVKQVAQNYAHGNYPGTVGYNEPTYLLSRWQSPGNLSSIQRYNSNFSLLTPFSDVQLYSDAAYGDASYLRLRNLSFSWLCPEDWCKKIHVKDCRIFINGQNLFTVTDYKGLDPETLSSTTLPILRITTIGLKIGL